MLSSRPVSLLDRRTVVRIGSGSLVAALALRERRSAEAHSLTILEANKALVHRLFAEAVNGGNVAVIGELYAPAVLKRRPAGQVPGPGGMPLPIDQFRTLFPDVSVTVEDTIGEVDFVATRAIWHGTHPPAEAHVVGRTMHMFRIMNGQIAEQWSTGWEWLVQRDYRSEPRPAHPLAGT